MEHRKRHSVNYFPFAESENGTTTRRLVVLASIMLLLGLAIGRSLPSALPSRATTRLATTTTAPCRPYDQIGVLLTDPNVPANNKWHTLGSTCRPEPFMSLLLTKKYQSRLSFLKNKFVVILGDEVDKRHVFNFCDWAGGELEMIHEGHEISPEYPVGRRRRPDGGKWDQTNLTRPHVCTVRRYGFRILQVFHQGFLPEDNWVLGHPSSYAPMNLEDRFNDILLPLSRSLSPSAAPDLISLSPGYWDLLRVAEADPNVNKWTNLEGPQMDWFQAATKVVIKGIVDSYAGERTRILWRTLQQIENWEEAAPNRITEVDAIGRRIIAEIIEEDDVVRSRSRLSLSWYFKLKAVNFPRIKNWRNVLPLGSGSVRLGYRLKIDPWGRLMLGQPGRGVDPVNPGALPGSWLFGDMLLTHLLEAVHS